jgi:hypothetical protein
MKVAFPASYAQLKQHAHKPQLQHRTGHLIREPHTNDKSVPICVCACARDLKAQMTGRRVVRKDTAMKQIKHAGKKGTRGDVAGMAAVQEGGNGVGRLRGREGPFRHAQENKSCRATTLPRRQKSHSSAAPEAFPSSFQPSSAPYP